MAEIFVGKTGAKSPSVMLSRMSNRHGLVAGATGTGKTVTLRVLAEAFSDLGVPVFAADIKGDLSGLAQPGTADNTAVMKRVADLELSNFSQQGYPVTLWDVYAKNGIPLRTTLSEFGPLLLSRLFDLNDVQEGVLNIAFRVADDQGLLLLDLKDLRAILNLIGENASEIQVKYGNVAKASIGAIQRDLLAIEDAGGDIFFGEPALRLQDLIRLESNGKGSINILDATKLISNPKLYSTFLLWLLSELFEQLPEVGDLEKPKIVFFFDEAHLLFDAAPDALLEKIEQMVRLIRSKGVGIFFVTQSPLDVPDAVLGQLGNRFQHALRAFTPRDQKAVRTAAETFRPNDSFDVTSAITELAVGEALVSCLDEKGVPRPVERVFITPPRSRLGVLSNLEMQGLIATSNLSATYKESVDRESAHEILLKRMNKEDTSQKNRTQKEDEDSSVIDKVGDILGTNSKRQGFVESFLKSAIRSLGGQLGRSISRGIFGNTIKQ